MTVATAFAVAAVLALAVAVLLVGRAAVATHAARSAADLAALAGAHALREGLDPCTAASGIAAANGADTALDGTGAGHNMADTVVEALHHHLSLKTPETGTIGP